MPPSDEFADKTSKTPPASPVVNGGPPSYPTGSRRGSNINDVGNTNGECDCENRSLLEVEAIGAIKEHSYAVDHAWISEMLPRTPELLFMNITTLEQHTYCVELTKKGWRIASCRQDCMNGDFRQLSLHTNYFETLNDLLHHISPEYSKKFADLLYNKLSKLEQNGEHQP